MSEGNVWKRKTKMLDFETNIIFCCFYLFFFKSFVHNLFDLLCQILVSYIEITLKDIYRVSLVVHVGFAFCFRFFVFVKFKLNYVMAFVYSLLHLLHVNF